MVFDRQQGDAPIRKDGKQQSGATSIFLVGNIRKEPEEVCDVEASEESASESCEEACDVEASEKSAFESCEEACDVEASEELSVETSQAVAVLTGQEKGKKQAAGNPRRRYQASRLCFEPVEHTKWEIDAVVVRGERKKVEWDLLEENA